MSDVRFALRHLGRSPAHVAVVILSLAIGLAVSITVFSAVNAIIFGVVPGIADRSGLIQIRVAGNGPLTRAQFEAAEAQLTGSFSAVAAHGERRLPINTPAGPSTTAVGFVSSRLFEALGTAPVLGRLLTTGDAAPDGGPVALISEQLWHESFDADPLAIGGRIDVAGRPFTVVGVTPSGLPGLHMRDVSQTDATYPQVWLPIREADASSAPWLMVAGRLRSSATLSRAKADVSMLSARMASTGSTRGDHARFVAYRGGLSWRHTPSEIAQVIGVFLFVPVGLLLIGCANVVNLQLARASERATELNVRLAMGASRMRLVRLLGIEIVVLASLAGGIGLWGATRMLDLLSPALPVPIDVDAHVAAFAAGLVTLAIALAGLAPAWLATHGGMSAGLKELRGGSVRFKRLRGALVIVQVGATLALLMISALGIRTLETRRPVVPAGATQILIADFKLADLRYTNARAGMFSEAVLEQLAGAPEVQAAGFADFFRFEGVVRYALAGDDAELRRSALGGFVTPSWFDAINIRLMAGRSFTAESTGSTGVVNERMASMLGAPGASALGLTLRVAHPPGSAPRSVEIVGVVQDSVSTADERTLPVIYLPMPASPPTSLTLVVRAVDVGAARAAIRAAVARADASVPWARLGTLDARLNDQFKGFSQIVWIGAGLGVLGLLLASAGLYAIMDYLVRRRTSEIGIRMAMGARPVNVVALVVREGLKLVMAGAIAGVLVAVPLAYLMRSALLGISPIDAIAMLRTFGVLAVVSLAALAMPAWRAARIDPLTALRHD